MMPPRSLRVAIVKPTLRCNADCPYCCSPPESAESAGWDVDRLDAVARFLAERTAGGATLSVIWHGGEPMLQGVAWYRRAHERFARAFRATGRGCDAFEFSMQTNLLRYGPRWRDAFLDPTLFGGRISTSFEPGGTRTVLGSPERYSRLFWLRFNAALDDGLPGYVIATLTEPVLGRCVAHALYDAALARFRARGRGFGIRLNYAVPTGRGACAAPPRPLIAPRAYADIVLEIGERWVADGCPFDVIPLVPMAQAKTGRTGTCPWTEACGGRFIAIEPSGALYNCSDFADLRDPRWSFGNVFAHAPDVEPLASVAARAHRRRPAQLDAQCRACSHLPACRGGCHRDAVLFDPASGVGGHFPYCEAWTAIFGWLDARPGLLRRFAPSIDVAVPVPPGCGA